MLPAQFQAQTWWTRLRSLAGRIRWQWILSAAAGVVVFYAAVLVFPRIFALFWYSGIKRLFYEDLAFSEAWSSFFAVIGSFVYAVLWVPLLRWTLRASFWKFNPRQLAAAFIVWVVAYGNAPFFHAILGSEVCVNQRTGEPLKWYVVQPGGEIVLFDSPGYDSTGAAKRPATAQICRIIQLQKRSIRPREIADDPRYVKFFNGVTGQPRVWYYKAVDGRIDLFDAEGTDPTVGEPLIPITKEIVQEVQARAAAKQAEAERAAQERAAEMERAARLAAERAEAEAEEKARRELIDVFGVASYSDGVVIVGASSRQKDDVSTEAARQLLNYFAASLRAKGIVVDEFRPKVYSTGNFDALINGNAEVLSEIGLAQKMRAALLSSVDASCRPASEVSGVISCTISAQVHLLTPNGNGSLRQSSETGAGTTTTQALARAAELLTERHPELLDGV